MTVDAGSQLCSSHDDSRATCCHHRAQCAALHSHFVDSVTAVAPLSIAPLLLSTVLCPRPSLSLCHGMRALSFATLLCSLFLLSLCPATTEAQSSSVTHLLIAGVSGCTDVGTVTSDCPLQTTVTLHLDSRTPAPVSSSIISTILSGPNYVSDQLYSSVSTSDPARLTLTLTIQPTGYRAGWTGANNFLNITFFDYATTSYSTPFAGVSFAYVPPPTLTSITGCATSDTAGTYGCAPDVDVLTITGSGLSWLSIARNWAAVLADIRSGWRVLVKLVDDSCLLLSLNQTYTELVFPVHYNGTVLSFGFVSYSYIDAPDDNGYFDYYNTNTLSISFIPLPPPSVTSVVVSNCNNTATFNLPAYYNCLPGVSVLVLTGHYMYELSVLLAGEPCIPTSAVSTRFTCTLPFITAYTPGYNYPLSVYNAAGNITQQATFSFTALPSIATVIPCSDHGGAVLAASPFCQAGSHLTVQGARFPNDPTVRVLLTTSWTVGSIASPNVSCLSAFVQDSGTVVCTLPTLNASFSSLFVGRPTGIRVLFNSSTWSTNVINRITYYYPDAPIINSVTASTGVCTATNSLTTLSTCGSDAVITISGQRFLGDRISITANGPVSNNAYYYINRCVEQDGYTDTTVVCAMPQTDVVSASQAVVAGFEYVFNVRVGRNGTSMSSNVFRVTFAPVAVEPDTHSSSTGLAPSSHTSTISAGATAGIVVGAVILVALAAAALLFYVRYRRMSASGSPKSDDGTSWQQRHSINSSPSSDAVSEAEVEMNVSASQRAFFA